MRLHEVAIIIDILPFPNFVIKQVCIINDHSVKKTIKLLFINPMGSIDFSIDPGSVESYIYMIKPRGCSKNPKRWHRPITSGQPRIQPNSAVVQSPSSIRTHGSESMLRRLTAKTQLGAIPISHPFGD